MVRISTYYDKDINEKVFMVRGDEPYARTTDTLCSLVTNWANREASLDGVRIGVTYNILRDIGASKVTLYNHNEVLGSYDWTDGSTETTIGNSSSGGFILPYGIEHRIWARYKGNDKCMGSKSKEIVFEYDVPSSFKTEVSFGTSSSTPTQINTGATLNGAVTVTVNGATPSSVYNLDVDIYVDGEYNQTVTTPSDSNTKSFSISGLEDGKHILRGEVKQSNTIRQGSKTQNLFVGYKLNIESYPSPFIGGTDNVITVSLHNMNDNPVINKSVSFGGSSATTDSNGVATFTLQTLTDGDYYASYNGNVSQTITIKNLIVNNISLALEDSITTKNVEEILTATVTGDNISNIPVTWQFSNSTSNFSSSASVIAPITSYTNSNGVATAVYKGNERGNYYVRASTNGANDTKIIEDVTKYWHQDSANNTTVLYDYTYNLGGYDRQFANPTNNTYSLIKTYNQIQVRTTTGAYSETGRYDYGFYFKKIDGSFVFSFDLMVQVSHNIESVYLGLSHKGVMINPNDYATNNVKIIYTSSTDTFKLYVDGVQKTATVVSQNGGNEASDYFYVSCGSNGNSNSRLIFNNLKYYKYNYGVS